MAESVTGNVNEYGDAYQGLCASTYDSLVPPDAVGDVDLFRHFIRDDGEPALEIGCGTGRVLLQYASEGLEVQGLDVSEEMLTICRDKGNDLGCEVPLHHQAMQSLDLALRFRTIYIPYYSFQLLTDDDDIAESLKRFRVHLEPKGRLLVPLFFPFEDDVGQSPAPDQEWRLRREAESEDGSRVECWEHAAYDEEKQVKRATLRFDIIGKDGEIAQSEERSLGIRWHTQGQFESRLAAAGFEELRALSGHSLDPARPDDSSFTFVARPERG